MNITFDTFNLIKANIGTNGLEEADFTADNQALIIVNTRLKNGEYGFANIVKTDETSKQCREVFNQISWAKQMLVLGIGGSDLGARMLQQALETENPPMQVYFAGDSTDPYPYLKLDKNLNYQDTVIVVVSKSGGTIETACAYLYFKQKLIEQIGDNWAKHFVFITDPKEGIMHEEAAKHNVLTLPVPNDVGGRFSVLTAVGLLPALAMGIDIEQLVNGANNYFQHVLEFSDHKNSAWQIAFSQYLFQEKFNVNTVVLMPYIARLELFSSWFAQLWAESSGKDGRGILPIKAMGPKDQHSQVQFYKQGKWLSSFIFIQSQEQPKDIIIYNDQIEQLKFLDHKNLSDIISAECMATRMSLANSGRPSGFLLMKKLDEQNLGELIALFELSIVYLCELLQVNPFDQPGVEEGKKIMEKMLGK